MFIVFEGLEGCGKTTVLQKTAEWLKTFREDVIVTREIGGTEVSEKIRNIVLNFPMNPITESLLANAGRAEHIENVITPKRKDNIVISDRYFPSTIAYQGYGHDIVQLNYDIMDILQNNCSSFYPDYLLYFDISYETMLHRMQIRAGGATDRIEAKGSGYFKKVFEGYRQVVKESSFPVYRIDAERPLEEVIEQVQEFFKISVLK